MVFHAIFGTFFTNSRLVFEKYCSTASATKVWMKVCNPEDY